MITPEIGKEYRVRLHGINTVVRLLEINKRDSTRSLIYNHVINKATTRYVCLNLATNRQVIIKSRVKFLSEHTERKPIEEYIDHKQCPDTCSAKQWSEIL